MAAAKSWKKPNYKTAVSKNVEKQRSEGRSYGYLNLPNGVELFKETKGRITVDIISYVISNPHHADIDKDSGIEVGTLWYKMPFKVHRGIGPGDGETVVCPTTFGKPCPICEYRKKRQAEGADKDEIKALNTSKRNLYAVIPLGVKDFEEKVHIWNTTDFFVQELINKELEENEDMACFPDLEDGFSLKFRFDEESFSGNKYYKPSRLDFEERDAYDEKILNEVPDLDKCIKVQSYKELEALLFQVEPEDVGNTKIADNDEDEKPTRRKKTVEKEEVEDEKPARRKKSEPEPDPEDDDDNDEDLKGVKTCPDCGGSGKTAKGKKCPTCEGSGHVPMDYGEGEDEDDDTTDEIPEGMEVCPDCHGSGTNARGRECKNCNGTGFVEIEEDNEPASAQKKKDTPRAEAFKDDAKKRGVKDLDEEEDEKPKAKADSKPAAKGKGKCPSGHEFGADNDAYPKDCKKCAMWDDCFDAQ